MNEISKLKQNKEFVKDKERVEKLFKEYKEAFNELENKYPLKRHYMQMMYSNTIEFNNKTPKHKINIRYGYDEMYPHEEHITDEDTWHKGQIGTACFENKYFYADNTRDDIYFEYGKEFEIEHDVVMGLPVYITITEFWE